MLQRTVLPFKIQGALGRLRQFGGVPSRELELEAAAGRCRLPRDRASMRPPAAAQRAPASPNRRTRAASPEKSALHSARSLPPSVVGADVGKPQLAVPQFRLRHHMLELQPFEHDLVGPDAPLGREPCRRRARARPPAARYHGTRCNCGLSRRFSSAERDSLECKVEPNRTRLRGVATPRKNQRAVHRRVAGGEGGRQVLDPHLVRQQDSVGAAHVGGRHAPLPAARSRSATAWSR